jgi:hypothetical protein
MLNNRSIAPGVFESKGIDGRYRRWLQRASVPAEWRRQPDGVLAACARGDQKRGDEKDPYGQRDGDNDDRRLHLGPMARRTTARHAAINEAVQVI